MPEPIQAGLRARLPRPRWGAMTLAIAQNFAAGAILTMLANTMFPEAFKHGGERVGIATALGFAAAFLLSRT
jgi:zinc transporter, ZIP family